MSNSPATPSSADDLAAKPAAPKRSPTERILVRGGIGILLVVLTIELSSVARMQITKAYFSSELKKSEASDHRVTQSTVDGFFRGRKPDQSHIVKATVGDERFDVYYFDGLLKRRELWIHYGIEGLNSAREVIEISPVTPEEVLSLL